MACENVKGGKGHCSDRVNTSFWLERCLFCEEKKRKRKKDTSSIPPKMNVLGKIETGCHGRMFLGGDEI